MTDTLIGKKDKKFSSDILNKAINIYDQAIDIKNDDISSIANSGLAYLELAMISKEKEIYTVYFNRALESLIRANKLNPKEHGLLRLHAKFLLNFSQKEDFDKSFDLINQGIDKLRDSLDIKKDSLTTYLLSEALLGKAKILSNSESEPLLRESISIAKNQLLEDPKNKFLIIILGLIMNELSFLEIKKDNSFIEDLNLLISKCNEYLRSEPEEISIINTLGRSYLMQVFKEEVHINNLINEAINSFEKSLLIKNNLESNIYLGLAYIEKWKIDQTEESINKAKEKFNEIKKDDIVWATYNLACIYSLLNDLQTSIKYLEESFKYNIKISRNRILIDKDFKNIKNTIEFKQILDIYKPLNKFEKELKELRIPLIITEGKTDWRHLKKALQKLQEQGKFTDLELNFFDTDIKMGDSELDKLCKNLALTKHEKRIICIFDNDSLNFIKKHGTYKNDLNYNTWENNVYSFCIPIPEHRKNYKNISIEFYYTDEEIMTTEKKTGRRLYFNNECYKDICESTNQLKKIVKLPSLNKEKEYEKKIFDEYLDMFLDENGNHLAISKANFANNIFSDKEGFNNFNFSEFSKIFSVIRNIINDI